MKRIIRNLSSEANRSFWEQIEESANEVSSWPDWKRGGINVKQTLEDDSSYIEINPSNTSGFIILSLFSRDETVLGSIEISKERLLRMIKDIQ